MANISLNDPMNVSTEEIAANVVTEYLRENTYIAIPATVVGNDNYESNQVVDVQPVIDMVDEAGKSIPAPVLKSRVVRLPSGGGFSKKLPVSVGDKVVLHYSHRELGVWWDGDGSNITQSTLATQLMADCWVELGAATRRNNQSPSKTDYVFEGPNTTITTSPDGSISEVTAGYSRTITPSGDVTIVADNSINNECKTKVEKIATSYSITCPASTFNGNVTVTGTITSHIATIGTLTASTSTLGAASFTTIAAGGAAGVTGSITGVGGTTATFTNGIVTAIS